MQDFNLKIVLTILGGMIFSFIFILLAFILPVKEEQKVAIKKPKGRLEIISQSLQK